jgi:hypothetical protein
MNENTGADSLISMTTFSLTNDTALLDRQNKITNDNDYDFLLLTDVAFHTDQMRVLVISSSMRYF